MLFRCSIPQGDGGAQTRDSEVPDPDASRKRKADPGDGEGPSSVRRKVASESAPDLSHANREQPPAPSLNSFKELLTAHQRIADRIQELCRELNTRVPGGFQAECLTEMLEERHGGDKMTEILRSLETEGRQSPDFQDILSDFKELRSSGVTEKSLRQDWQGRR